jgi:hypothetical protein
MCQPNRFFITLDDDAAYLAWRDKKLQGYPKSVDELIVAVRDPIRLDKHEHAAIRDLLERTNMAVWAAEPDPEHDKIVSLNIGMQFGLQRLDHNMGADHDGVSELTVREGQWRAGYIPYTNRPIHWHTDGYYNTDEHKILGMVLYCVQAAAKGGENALLDHEIAYIHLRDTNPEYIRALMHPLAMTIPANIVNGQELRPDRAGPVFSILEDGFLHMRYTARARNVIWREDPLTHEAVACLNGFLASDSPYIFRATLEPGQGLICNNVLHDRSGFENDETHERKLYRLRYYDRAMAGQAGS